MAKATTNNTTAAEKFASIFRAHAEYIAAPAGKAETALKRQRNAAVASLTRADMRQLAVFAHSLAFMVDKRLA